VIIETLGRAVRDGIARTIAVVGLGNCTEPLGLASLAGSRTRLGLPIVPVRHAA
jgi:hypothetical protein